MAKNPTEKIASFSDHEVITPPNPLSRVVSHAVAGDDPVARAEAALSQLSSEFPSWMNDECEKLEEARRRAREAGMRGHPVEALYRAAHDMKGQATTLGFPLVAAVAESLCRLMEHARNPQRIPPELLDQHVDAMRAITRERDRAGAEAIADKLCRSLHEATEGFLRHEGKDLDEIESGPSIAP